MEKISTSRKQLYIGMVLFGIIALLLFAKMVTSKTPVPDGISYVDEQKTTIGGFSNQEQIVIPEGVVCVDGERSYDVIYDKVRSLSIPSTMEDLGDPKAFENAFPNVEEIVLGKKSSSQGYTYENGIFYQKIDGKEVYAAIAIKQLVTGDVVMPTTVHSMRADLLKGCNKMTSLTIGSVFRYADYGEETYEYLDSSCFEGCDNLKEFKVTGKNDYYKSRNGSLCCRDVDNTENIEFQDWKLHIVPRGYEGEYVVGFDVVTVGAGAFNECDKVTSIYISMGVTEIKDYAVVGCDLLEHITIPATVQYINQSFVECPKLTVINFTGDVYYQKMSYEHLQGEGTKLEKIRVPLGAMESYQSILAEDEAVLIVEGDYVSNTPLLDELQPTEAYVTVKAEGTLYFQWLQVPYAEGYHIQMEKNGWWDTVFTLKRTHSCYVKSLTVADVGMKEGFMQRFRVVAYAGGSITSVSAEMNACYITPPKIMAVKNKEAGSIYVSWQKKAHVSGYYVELMHEGNIENMFWIDDITQTNITIDNLKTGEVYGIRVYTYQNDGEQKIYSDYNSDACNIAL